MEDKGFDNPQFLTGFISREQMLQRIQEVPLEEDIPFDFLIRTSQLPQADQTPVREQACLHNMRATTRDQLNGVDAISPTSYSPVIPIEHRKQSGPYCSLESIHRALRAIGVTVSTEAIVARGMELGYSDGAPLLLIQSIIEKMGLADSVDIQMYPEKESVAIRFDKDTFRKAFIEISPKGTFQSQTTHEAKFHPSEPKDEELARKVNEWISLIRDRNALVLQIANAAAFWGIPEQLRATDDHTHAVAVVGYQTDEKGRLTFQVYDPAFNEAPISVGPRHLAQNTAYFYLKLRKK